MINGYLGKNCGRTLHSIDTSGSKAGTNSFHLNSNNFVEEEREKRLCIPNRG